MAQLCQFNKSLEVWGLREQVTEQLNLLITIFLKQRALFYKRKTFLTKKCRKIINKIRAVKTKNCNSITNLMQKWWLSKIFTIKKSLKLSIILTRLRLSNHCSKKLKSLSQSLCREIFVKLFACHRTFLLKTKKMITI